MKILDKRFNDGYSTLRVYVIDPDSTEVAAVKKESKKLIEAHAALNDAERVRDAAKREADDAADAARRAARAAGEAEKPLKKGEVRKAATAAREEYEDVLLDWEAAVARMQKRRLSYLEVLEHHTPALRAEGKAALDAAILSLASASQMALRTEAALSGALELLGLLASPDHFPVALRAERRQVTASGSPEAGAPVVHVGLARAELSKAVGYAMQVLDSVKAAEKVARLEKEADESPDITDESDDDDDDDAAEALDPDLYDVNGDEAD